MFANPARTLNLGSFRSLRRSGSLSLRDENGLAARLRDLLLRRLREGVRSDGDLLGELAVAEDLDAVDVALDQAAIAERALIDVRAGVELVELAEVDLGHD